MTLLVNIYIIAFYFLLANLGTKYIVVYALTVSLGFNITSICSGNQNGNYIKIIAQNFVQLFYHPCSKSTKICAEFLAFYLSCVVFSNLLSRFLNDTENQWQYQLREQ